MPQDAPPKDWTTQRVTANLDAFFGSRLRDIRDAAGLTQQQLASQMNATGHKMHRSAIAKIESGDRPVSLWEAVQLARILGVEMRELITDADAKREKAQERLVRARAAVGGLQIELNNHFRQVEEAQVLLADTEARLEEARKHLAALEGNDR